VSGLILALFVTALDAIPEVDFHVAFRG
jgi:hypothetical protein